MNKTFNMDHQLDDSLNLESAMGVEFDHDADVVSQEDVMDGVGHNDGIPMEFEHIKEQPMLMETGHEEIIGSGLMGDQFTIGGDAGYVDMVCSVPLDQDNQALITSNMNSQHQIITSETLMDLQFEPQTQMAAAPTTNTQQVTYTIKAASRTPRQVAIAPKEVAIAPKPSPLVTKPFFTTKPFSMAPKTGPVSVTGPRATLKKVQITGVGQKDQSVLAHIGKQLVMLPAGSSHKIKLVQSSGISMAQIVNAKNVVSSQAAKKPIMTKVVVQNEPRLSDQSAVITKLTPASGGAPGAPRFVTMQQRTVSVPQSVQNKVIMGATTNTVRLSKPKQTVVSLKGSPTKLGQLVSVGKVNAGQKFVLSNQPRNLVLKQAIPHKAISTPQAVKPEGREHNVINVAGGQRAELHEVNGVQYIRLVSNASTSTTTKVVNATAKQGQVVALPSNKTIMLTDNKGNLIQMGAEKVLGGQPPPLVFTTTQGNKVTAAPKPQQRLVRIAPVMAKTSQASISQPRPGQSLLAPITPDPVPRPLPPVSPPMEEDSKAALRQLIEDVNKEVAEHNDQRESYTEENNRVTDHEVEVQFERMSSPVQEENTNSSEQSPPSRQKQQMVCKQEDNQDHPLIVVPSNYTDGHNESSYTDQQDQSSDVSASFDERFRYGNIFMNPDLSSYQTPMSPPHLSDNELDNRPRKACNCTKSQCLKLYCDCFANGEFCNRCNCNNCHNNLENEELRQKAIRGCLDRNPNAFRPKIGKSKAGGPETVRRHNKGCNCKRSGCLKNYCECYEAKIACTAICKCVGCRNVEEALERLLRRREAQERKGVDSGALFRPPPLLHVKQPCTFMTTEVIEAVCQCLIAAAAEQDNNAVPDCEPPDPVKGVLDEFARCLQDIISAAHQGPPLDVDEGPIL